MKLYECVWYDENGNYVLLDFDPNGMTKTQIIKEATKELKRMNLTEQDIAYAFKTVYLLEVGALKKVIEIKQTKKERIIEAL